MLSGDSDRHFRVDTGISQVAREQIPQYPGVTAVLAILHFVGTAQINAVVSIRNLKAKLLERRGNLDKGPHAAKSFRGGPLALVGVIRGPMPY